MGLGIVIDRFTNVPIGGWWLVAILCLSAWHLIPSSIGKTSLLLLAVAATTGVWHQWHWNYFAANHIWRYAQLDTKPCAVEVVALESPTRCLAADPSPYRAIPSAEESRLEVHCERIRNGKEWQPTAGLMQLTIDGLVTDINRGDRLVVFAQFAQPAPASNPGDFDYQQHLRAERQLVMLLTRFPDCVETIARGSSLSPLRQIDRLRSYWSDQLWQLLPPQRAAMASALLLGAEGALPREDTTRFRTTGTTHVLVVSGLHTSIVVGLIYAAVRLGWLRNRAGLLAVVGLATGFAVLTGMNPPVIRAAVLIVLAALATLFGRRVLSYNSLGVALVVVLAINPAELFRSGTQLSFLCVITLVAFGEWLFGQWRDDPLDRLMLSANPWWWRWGRTGTLSVWNTAVASGCVWLVSLPLIVSAYGIVTPIAVIISPLLFLLLWIVLITGFAMLLVSLCSPWLATLLAIPNNLSIASLDSLVTWSNAVPWGHFWTFGPSLWWVAGAYGIAGLLWTVAPRTLSVQRSLRLLAVWTLIGCVPIAFTTLFPPKSLTCHMIDVGHGACVAIESPAGRVLLYDAGSLGSPYAATERVSSFLWSRGHRRIDAIVISHADVDHFNAVPGLVERFEIGVVYVSPHMFSPIDSPKLAPAPAALEKLLSEKDIPVRVIELGDRLTIDDNTAAEVLHPGPFDIAGGDNSRSIVLGIEFAGKRILLPGDLESPGLDAVISSEAYDCDILLAPHHGSRRSDPPGFADWSTPEWVVISGSQDLGIAEVTESYSQRGARVLNTSVDGCVSFELTTEQVNVSTFR